MLDSLTELTETARVLAGPPVRFPLRLRRAWQRETGRLGLQYVDSAGRVVPGQWCVDHEEARTLYQRLDRASGRGVLVQVADRLIVLQPEGADHKLPGIGRALAMPDAELLTHRPGRRAVIRYTDGQGVLYAKALRPSKIDRIIRATGFVADLPGRAFSIAPTHSADASAGLLVTGELPGESLHDLAETDPTAFIKGCGMAGHALRSLHVEAPSWLPVHDAAAEIEMLKKRAAGIQVFIPGLYETMRTVCRQVCEALDQSPSGRSVLHRDFYDKQIVIRSGDEPGLLDFDTLGAGEPALDLANMLAHIELRVLQDAIDPSTARAASVAFLDAYGPGRECWRRIPVYLDAVRLRLAMLYACRPKWAGLAPMLLETVGGPALGDAAQKPVAREDRQPTTGPARMHDRTAKPACPLVFVMGCPRSGTTMLERMLDAHHDLAMTHETHWVTKHTRRGGSLSREGYVLPHTLDALYEDHRFSRMAPPRDVIERMMEQRPLKYRRFVRAVFNNYRKQQGKPYVGDKSTGGYLRNIDRLRKVCPNSKIVHLVRDGREVCLSMMNWPKAPRAAGRFGVFADDPVATTAAWWDWHIRAGIEQGRPLGPGVYRETRYEQLVREPERVCAELCAFLGLDPDPEMARFYSGRAKPGEGKSANAAWLAPTPGLRDWRTQMRDDQIEMFEAVAGETLSMLGYERKFPRISQKIAELAAERTAEWNQELASGPRVSVPTNGAVTAGISVQKGELK